MDIATSIIFAELPGAHFATTQAVREHGRQAARIETVLTDFEVSGDEVLLWEALRSLGFEYDEIQWCIDHPGQRLECGYV